jgi:hypothetical protein
MFNIGELIRNKSRDVCNLSKQDVRPARIVRLYFCKTADNAWRVYQWVGGQAKNWEVTSGRKWKTMIEAKNFLKQQGWCPR